MTDAPPNVPKPPSWPSISFIGPRLTLEYIAKYGTALGIVALATAFAYDALFWAMIDLRILKLSCSRIMSSLL